MSNLSKHVSTAVLCICLVGHLIIGGTTQPLKSYAPMGILIVLFIYPLGVIIENAWPRVTRYPWPVVVLVSAAASILCACVSNHVGTHINIGGIKLYDYTEFSKLLLHDIYILGTFTFVFSVSRYLSRIRFFVLLGKHSLLIYLTHSTIFYFIYVVSFYLGINRISAFFAITSLVITVVMSLTIAMAISNHRILSSLITPRDAKSWFRFS